MLALLRRGLFMIISAFTTTGFQVVTTNQITTAFSNGAFLTLAFIMAVGGASGSTAGGIKFSRMGIIFKSIVSNVKETLAPDSARVVVSYKPRGQAHLDAGNCERGHDGVHPVRDHLRLSAHWWALHTGFEAIPAISESVAMTSNGGIITSVAGPAWREPSSCFTSSRCGLAAWSS